MYFSVLTESATQRTSRAGTRVNGDRAAFADGQTLRVSHRIVSYSSTSTSPSRIYCKSVFCFCLTLGGQFGTCWNSRMVGLHAANLDDDGLGFGFWDN